MCTPGQIFIQRRDGHVEMGQCAKFGVASLKIHKLRGSQVQKTVPLWHVPLVQLITGYPNGFRPPMVAIGPKSLSRIRPLVCPAASENQKEVQILCTCPARARCTPDQLFMWRLDAPVQLCQCAKFGVAS